jgi:hypothetical protein
LRRPKLDSRTWLAFRVVGRGGAGAAAIYEGLDDVPGKVEGSRDGIGHHWRCPARLRAEDRRRHRLQAGPSCQPKKREGGRGRLAAVCWAGPLRSAGVVWEGRRASREKSGKLGFRPEAEKENISFSFSFSNTPNTFSNNFWNHCLLEIK